VVRAGEPVAANAPPTRIKNGVMRVEADAAEAEAGTFWVGWIQLEQRR
jgi:hypothetical protein